MPDKFIHIVCLDVPYPVDYGGVFDLFYKLKSLSELGIYIHLHCFEYGRGKQDELKQYCKSVTYYKRKSFLKSLSFRLPYIVSSRSDRLLLNNLLADDYPVLLEGIHCTYLLYTNELTNKKVFVRLHNVEFEYYKELAKATKDIFRKLYLEVESHILKKYEKNISRKAPFLSVSEKDKETYQQKFNAKEIKYLPVFLPFKTINSQAGSGSFCLYHGNLSVPENEKAALWLIENVFDSLDVPFIIAGKKPSAHLKNTVDSKENFCLIENPSNDDLDDLIKKAHIHLVPSFNKTGIKIKLLNALFNGRYVIASSAAVEDINLKSLCSIANSANDYKKYIRELIQIPFEEGDIIKRKQVLENIYNNIANAQKLIRWIW